MNIRSLNKDFNNTKMFVASLSIIFVSLFLCLLISLTGYETGYLVIGAILFLVLCVFSLINFKIGFYSSVTFGFLIFLLGRVSTSTFPLGVLVELPLYLGFIKCLSQRDDDNEVIESHPMHVISIFMIIITLYSFLQLFNPNSFNFLAWIYTFRRIIMYGLIYYLSFKIFSSFRDVIFFFKYWITMSFAAAVYGCYEHWFGFFDFDYIYITSSPVLEQLFSLGNGEYRIFSIFSDPSAFGLGMAATLLLSLVLMINTKGFRKKIFFIRDVFIFVCIYN
jgi:hypothetical protein